MNSEIVRAYARIFERVAQTKMSTPDRLSVYEALLETFETLVPYRAIPSKNPWNSAPGGTRGEILFTPYRSYVGDTIPPMPMSNITSNITSLPQPDGDDTIR